MDAIAVDLQNNPQFDTKDRLPRPIEITRFGLSLVSLVKRGSNTELELAHFSVKEYLTTKVLLEAFQREMSEATARGHITRSCLAYLTCLRAGESINDITA